MQFRKILGFALLAMCVQSAGAVDISSNYGVILGKYVAPDSQRDADYGVGAHLIYGVPLMEGLDLEINGFSYASERKTSTADDYGYGGGLDLRYALADSRSFGLFFLFGLGGLYEDIGTEGGVSPYANAGFSLNFWNIFGVPNLSLRADARYYGVAREESSGFTNPAFTTDNFGDAHFNFGFQLDFLGSAKQEKRGMDLRDTDGDGMIDSRDECPGTPLNAQIDGRGCPLPEDSDGDGINDNLDKCPNTPIGTVVDPSGCPLVIAPVATPLPISPPTDSDNDGVPDALDACPATPIGLPVDARGCPLSSDFDNDGVVNEIDQCPSTPPGMKVDARGCVIKQTVVFNTINFELASDQLTPAAKEVLDGIAVGLRGQPTMTVEISGHTDSLGAQAYNLTLSQNRARSVKAYLMSKGVLAPRMQTEGFGEFNPISDNETEAGRAKNRRVEFKITKQ